MRRSWAALGIGGALLLSAARAPAAAAPDVPLATWVWDARHVTAPAGRERLLQFCAAQHITALYLSAYQFAPEQAAAYRALNRAAHRRGVLVHALAGDPRWAQSRYHHLPLAWMDTVIAFNHDSASDERFDGIHTDIEPYLLSRAWAEHPARLLGGLLDLHAKMARIVGEHRPLHVGADIPFWFDDDPTYEIQWHDHVQPASYHLLDVLDYVTVMAYRNFAAGSSGTVALARNEVAYAARVGKVAIVGQETQRDLVPAYITFGGMSREYFWGEVAKVIQAFTASRGFGGIAVHHYESFQELVGT